MPEKLNHIPSRSWHLAESGLHGLCSALQVWLSLQQPQDYHRMPTMPESLNDMSMKVASWIMQA